MNNRDFKDTLPFHGLAEQEVDDRRRRGQGNDVHLQTSRSYVNILRQNILTFINIVLFGIGAVLILIGRVSDALVSIGLISMNIIIGVSQEIRAKRQLDRIALLTRPKVSVVREGQEKVVDPGEVVLGDILIARPGDQIVVDGTVISRGDIEVDESLLTGESDRIAKDIGDTVLSGSFCTNGKLIYEATRVGRASYVNQLTAEARTFRVVRTPLQKEIDFLIRLLTLIASFIGLLLLTSAVLYALPLMRSAQIAAVIAGLVPNGLFFMVIAAYAMGALRIVRHGALVQQANAVESLSNVDILCMDKTGTITTNQLMLHDLYAIDTDPEQLKQTLGDYVRSASLLNRTSEAIRAVYHGRMLPTVDEVPFASTRKWSALAFNNEKIRGVYVLGATEILKPNLRSGFDLEQPINTWTAAGLRVLLFAHHPDVTSLHNSLYQPNLPQDLIPLGLVSFSDELRPKLKETLADFTEANITIKVISGDHPQTVAALVRQADLPGDTSAVVDGIELMQMETPSFEQSAVEGTIFGRITPEQKEKLVEALRGLGHFVAMIGDGVNDVLSLKKSNLGIAMQSGSAATRAVADMILLDDTFEALPFAFLEGQRIVNGMQDILRLFLTRAFYFALLMISTAIIGIGFPYVPKHATLVTLFTVGIPTFALTVWARPGPLPEGSLTRAVMRFVIPATLSMFVLGLLIYSLTFGLTHQNLEARSLSITPAEIDSFRIWAGIDYPIQSLEAYITEVTTVSAQTALTSFTLLAGLILIVFAEPPTHFFVGGDVYSGDKRPTILATILFFAFLAVMVIAPLRKFFELLILPPYTYGVIAAAVLVWLITIRQAWRARWLERFLNIEP
ncbi:MAG: HAD-IC family P-type ATPase [Anaerolineales bacterium]|nr:HAD-IC family P-type ATPase [Anaerolineales bacterium]